MVLAILTGMLGVFGILQAYGVLSDVPVMSYGVPAVLSCYFDLFSGFVQAYVFTLLTMVYIAGSLPEPKKETGYAKRHSRNLPFVEFIEKHFTMKKSVGVQVYEEMRKIENMNLGKRFQGEWNIMRKTFSPAAHLLTAHSIPTIYEENAEIAIAFGENAKYIELNCDATE